MNWQHKVKIKHLMTENEDWDSVQKSMNQIADILINKRCFIGFNISKFRKIPKGNDVIGPCDYANKLIAKLYDFADYNRIWIE